MDGDGSGPEEAIGYVNFDSQSTDSNGVEIMVPQSKMRDIRRGQYVRIESNSSGEVETFFAMISKGLFFEPDAVSKDSAFAKAAVLYAGSVKFRPEYHARCSARIIGGLDADEMKVYGTFARPMPQGSVHPLTGEQIEKLLELDGDMFVGYLDGYSGVKVRLPSDKNAALPRNIGIFGTVGSGKTNTSQVLIEEAASHNWAVIVLDVEGEYVDMDKPSTEAALRKMFGRFGIEPNGIDSLDVYHPIKTEPSRQDSKPFSVRFASIGPHILSEIMGLSQAQNERFIETWTNITRKSGQNKKGKSATPLLDLAMDGADSSAAAGFGLADMIGQISTILAKPETKGSNRVSYFALLRKLRKLDGYDIFDKRESLGDCSDLLRANRVSVIDLSGSFSSQINNIVLMDLLGKIFKLKLNDREKRLPPTLIAIEEAHTLVSRHNSSEMAETLDKLREIARRGRKRWLSLCFISQQPSHLPPEIYELCNTKIAHQTTGSRNLDAIKNSTGGVDDSIWHDVPRLGQGRCLFISSYFKNRPMFVNVRPCMSSRRHTESD